MSTPNRPWFLSGYDPPEDEGGFGEFVFVDMPDGRRRMVWRPYKSDGSWFVPRDDPGNIDDG